MPILTSYPVPFLECIAAELNGLPASSRTAWQDLIEHGLTAGKLTLPKGYHSRLAELAQAVGGAELRNRSDRWLATIPQLPVLPWQDYQQLTGEYPGMGTDYQLLPPGVNVVRALLLARTSLDAENLATGVERLATWAAQTIKGRGLRSTTLFSAAIRTLSLLSSAEEGGAALSRLRGAITRASFRKKLDKELVDVSERLGVSVEDLVERGIEDHGLRDGIAERRVGKYIARVAVVEPGKSTLTWRKPDGKIQRSVPAAVKVDHPDLLADLKTSRKQLDKATSTQAARIERLYLTKRVWPLSAFAKTYLAHGLLGHLARSLVWWIMPAKRPEHKRSAVYSQGRWQTANGTPLQPEADSTVRLWHPAGIDPAETAAWSRWLDSTGTVQPFSQVRRTVYAPNATEIQRRACLSLLGHSAQQSRLRTRCLASGWQMQMFGGFDGGDANPITLALTDFQLVARLNARAPDDVEHNAIAKQVIAGELSWLDEASQPVQLPDVAARVYSEVVRSAIGLFS